MTMVNKLTLKQALNRVGVFTLIVGLVITVGYTVCFRLISQSKERFANAVKIFSLMDDATINLNETNTRLLAQLAGVGTTATPSLENESPKSIQEAKSLSNDPAMSRALQDVSSFLESTMIPTQKEAVDTTHKGAASVTAGLKNLQKVRGEMSELLDTARTMAIMDALKNSKAQDSLFQLNSIILFTFLIAGFLFVYWYNRRVARSFGRELEEIGGRLQVGASTVNQASHEMAMVSRQLSDANTKQSSAIAETVASMEEMTAMLSQTVQNANGGLKLAEEGLRESGKGKEVIGRLVKAMDEIRESNGKLEAIVKIIEEIRNKTKVINNIVFETRLLSFNASIEAARAGVHGKGFAVVAEEVGKLATVSGSAAEEIARLLESSSLEVSSVVRNTLEKVSLGKEITQECETSFTSMSSSLDNITNAIHLISTAAHEQEGGVKETNKAMHQMDQLTQKNSASSEQMTAQAGALSEEARALAQSVDALRKVVIGHDRTDTPQSPNSFSSAPTLTDAGNVVPMPPRDDIAAQRGSNVNRNDRRWKSS
jgi:methyl-accepting chemotaxis protein